MSGWTDAARWRAAGTAALLLVTGGILGIVADRLWLAPPPREAMALNPEAMAERLGLSPSEAARVESLLHDSLHPQIHAAVQQGPDSLRAAVSDASRRIEAALPPEAHAEFEVWMQEQYERMLEHIAAHGRRGSGTHQR